ncbi:hypothetical protein A8F94_15765 [Bacillus sp. FJAT-27225]|uniref:DUF4275 family protein n=1 Tax=Bacillus sp. FJAT-27225 TaxID=1743144 RepID=UPI00080C3183|nr:DUF4275 family protein [Bacillus sp. FJAT-27225]OCA84176.1 hypothetical protein A8F94_15765 [Bacillus sp. FJAT-27225]
MELQRKLIYKDVEVEEAPGMGRMFRKQWEERFAGNLSKREKLSIHLYDKGESSGFLWHIFSYEKQDCLEGKAAEQAFNAVRKYACYVFYQNYEDALILKNAKRFTADDLKNEYDVYVVDKDFTWTYVKTHETGWIGPYFYKDC